MLSFLTSVVEVAIGIVVADAVTSDKGQQVIKASCDKIIAKTGFAYGYVAAKVSK